MKSTLEVAPIWLKKNTRIEALIFVAQPERRASKTPTIEQVLRLFEHQDKHALYDGDRLIQQFADSLTSVQTQVLELLSIPTAAYRPAR